MNETEVQIMPAPLGPVERMVRPGAETPRWWYCDTHGAGNHTAWGCPECVREMRAENLLLRRMLATRVAGALLYADDGELQDNTATPCIDFRRTPAEQIEAALIERNRRKAEDDAYWGTRQVLGA